MEYIKYATKEEFLKENLDILLKEEAKNEIMIGILLEHENDSIQNWILGRIEKDGEAKVIFLIEDEREGLLIYSLEETMSEDVVEYLVENVLLNIELKEVLTSKENAMLISDIYSKKARKEAVLYSNMYIMTFDKIEEQCLLEEKEMIEKLEKETVNLDVLKENIKEMYKDNFRGRECSDEEADKVSEAFLRKGIYVLNDKNM